MLQYFGTNLDSAGHYFWELKDGIMYRSRKSFGDYPFNPEGLPYNKGQGLRNGDTQFYHFAGFSIYAIEGSCTDSRRASKSIFFIEQEMTKDELKALILNTPISKRIIIKMPFGVTW